MVRGAPASQEATVRGDTGSASVGSTVKCRKETLPGVNGTWEVRGALGCTVVHGLNPPVAQCGGGPCKISTQWKFP